MAMALAMAMAMGLALAIAMAVALAIAMAMALAKATVMATAFRAMVPSWCYLRHYVHHMTQETQPHVSEAVLTGFGDFLQLQKQLKHKNTWSGPADNH